MTSYAEVESDLGSKGLEPATAQLLTQLLGDGTSTQGVTVNGDLKGVTGGTKVLFVDPDGGSTQTFNFKNLPKDARESVDVVVFDDNTPVKATFGKAFSGVVVLGDVETGNKLTVDTSKSGGALVQTGSGADSVRTGSGADTVVTTGGNDTVKTGSGADSVITGNGNDSVNTGAGADSVITGVGSDTIKTGSGSDVIAVTDSGTSGDVLFIDGGSGRDRLDLSGVDIGSATRSGNTVSITLDNGAVIKVINVEDFTYDSASEGITTVGVTNFLLGNFGSD